MIRRMQETDTLQVFTLMRAFYDQRRKSVADDVLWQNISNCLGDYPYCEAWVMLEAGTIVGYAIVGRGYDVLRAGVYARVEDICISDAHPRREDALRAFLQALPGLCPGITMVTTEVGVTDTYGQRICQWSGYDRNALVMMAKPPAKRLSRPDDSL